MFNCLEHTRAVDRPKQRGVAMIPRLLAQGHGQGPVYTPPSDIDKCYIDLLVLGIYIL